MTREEALNKAINIVRYFEAHFAKSKEAREDAANIIEALEQEPCEDCISRQAVLDKAVYTETEEGWSGMTVDVNDIEALPSVNTKKPKTGYCKDCKYFEYDSLAKVDGVKLIFAHEICKRWGDGCKTSEEGFCFLFEPQESEDK